jgi:hypothetical protein
MSRSYNVNPIFNRSEVAQILNVSTLTVSNREKNRKVSYFKKRFK